jgi:hypothetical protein
LITQASLGRQEIARLFPPQMLRWSCNSPLERYERSKFVTKKEIPEKLSVRLILSPDGGSQHSKTSLILHRWFNVSPQTFPNHKHE